MADSAMALMDHLTREMKDDVGGDATGPLPGVLVEREAVDGQQSTAIRMIQDMWAYIRASVKAGWR